jgi:hypothetical protein
MDSSSFSDFSISNISSESPVKTPRVKDRQQRLIHQFSGFLNRTGTATAFAAGRPLRAGTPEVAGLPLHFAPGTWGKKHENKVGAMWGPSEMFVGLSHLTIVLSRLKFQPDSSSYKPT